MSLIVLCLGTRYDVYECNSLRDMTTNSFFVTFDLHLWPWAYVNVTFTSISRCILCSCTLVPSIKRVGSIEFEIWTIVYIKRKWRHNDVITHSTFMKFQPKSTKGISKRHTILIEHNRAEIWSREVNRELWRKNGNYVTMTLTFGPRSPISIGFEPVRWETILRKRVQIGTSVWLEFCSQENSRHTHRQTHRHTHTDKLQWKYNPSTISWRCSNLLCENCEIACQII